MAFLGRSAPEKGVDRAIEIAPRTGLPLRIAATVDPADRDYFEGRILPLLDGPVMQFVGEISEAESRTSWVAPCPTLSHLARALRSMMIEAMACGTPVIAFNQGAVPEVMRDGKIGFIVENVHAVGHLDTIDRAVVRATFERRFSVEVMAAKYEGRLCRHHCAK